MQEAHLETKKSSALPRELRALLTNKAKKSRREKLAFIEKYATREQLQRLDDKLASVASWNRT